jgi:hypothetical protein
MKWRQILAVVAATGVVIAVVDACSRTGMFPVFRNPGGAVLVYGLSMTLVWVVRQVVPCVLPPRYQRLRPIEIDGRLYRDLGIVTFKWLLFKSGVERLNFSARLSHGRAGLVALERGIREAETDHAIALLVMVVVTLYAAVNARWALTSWLLLANVVANVYPIMLQRHNRARLLPVLRRLGRRRTRQSVTTVGPCPDLRAKVASPPGIFSGWTGCGPLAPPNRSQVPIKVAKDEPDVP